MFSTVKIRKYVSTRFWVLDIFVEREKFVEFHTLFPKFLDQPINFFKYTRISFNIFFLYFT